MQKTQIADDMAAVPGLRRDHRTIGSQNGLFSLDLDQESTLIWHPKGFQILNDLMEYLRVCRKQAGSLEVHRRVLLRTRLQNDPSEEDSERFFPRMFKRFIGQPLHLELLPLSLFEINIHTLGQAPQNFPSLLHGSYPIQERSDTLCTGAQVQHVFQSDLQFNLELYERLGLDKLFILCRRDKINTQFIASDGFARQQLLHELSVPEDRAWNSFNVEFYLRDCFDREWLLGQVTARKCLDCSEKVYDPSGYRLPLYIVHSYALGSIERFIAIMLEHKAQDLPLWLTPIQILIIPVNKRHDELASDLHRQLQIAGIRSEVASGQGAVGYRVRGGKNRRIPYLATIDDNDAANGEITLYATGRKVKNKLPLAQAASFFQQCLLSPKDGRSFRSTRELVSL